MISKFFMPIFLKGIARIPVLSAVLVLPAIPCASAQSPDKEARKILFVVTSHGQKGTTGEETGFYLSEAAHPWEVLKNAGYEIDFVSPKGGKAPVEALDLSDAVNKRFWEDVTSRGKIENTLKPSEINPDHYTAIHYAGGHGAMWDFADNAELSTIAAEIYESGGIVSAVCHGPAGLVNIKLSDGRYLVQGKKINAFTNEEEAAVGLEKVVPFLLESKLVERGAIFEKSGPWQPHTVADRRVVTGQNPQSAKAVGEAVLEQLKAIELMGRLTRYTAKSSHQEILRKLLTEYVLQATDDQGNIQAEAFYEQDDPSVLWLIERWRNRNDLERFGSHPASKAIDAVKAEALTGKAETYLVKDLEPLPKEAWRRTAGADDQPLTVMLFVDSKPGTEDEFKEIYHQAMPQFRSEPGVITYQLSQVQGEATKFVTYEKFRNKAAFSYHLGFPPIAPVIHYLQTGIQKQPFQTGLHTLVEFAPAARK